MAGLKGLLASRKGNTLLLTSLTVILAWKEGAPRWLCMTLAGLGAAYIVMQGVVDAARR